MQPSLRIVCAYCGKVKDGNGPVLADEGLSHGICRTCFVERFSHMFTEDEITKMYEGENHETA